MDAHALESGVSLLDREPTPEDVEAEREAARPGVWSGEPGADLRKLTQDETDAQIRAELIASVSFDERGEVARACGVPVDYRRVDLPVTGSPSLLHAYVQRGGIDSDPLVRILARRAWGDRDRQWFEMRGVRKGEEVEIVSDPRDPVIIAKRWVGRWSAGTALGNGAGTALGNGAPGDQVDVEWSFNGPGDSRVLRYRVGDRLREPPPQDPAIAAVFESTIAQLEEDYVRALERSAIQAISVAFFKSTAFDPGARNPGVKPKPTVPRWARDRRVRARRPGSTRPR